MGCQGWDQMANTLVDKVCTPAMADQVKSCCSNSKEKITIAKRIAEKEHKTTDFWDIFHSALKPDPKKEDIYSKIALFDTLFLTTSHLRNTCESLILYFLQISCMLLPPLRYSSTAAVFLLPHTRDSFAV